MQKKHQMALVRSKVVPPPLLMLLRRCSPPSEAGSGGRTSLRELRGETSREASLLDLRHSTNLAWCLSRLVLEGLLNLQEMASFCLIILEPFFSHSGVALFEFPTVLGVPTRFSICQNWNAKLILLGWVRSVVSYPFTPPCILINPVVSPCPLNKTIFPTFVYISQHLQWVSTWQPVYQFVKFAFLVE